MEFTLWTLLAIQIVIVFMWGWGLGWVRRLRDDSEMTLAPQPGETDEAGPRLTVVIAAHNEQERIEPCLRRLLAQNYGNLRVTVVNDRSDDRTRERVLGVMAQDPRVSLVDVSDLPAGWTGKTHALARGVQETDGEYLLFTDCDCRFVPGALAAVMQKVTRERLEFVSLWPRLDLVSPWEQSVSPAASWLLGLWGLWLSARGSSNSQVELGNGQFMLFSRAAYVRVGGHAGVRAELAEDIILAKKIAALGIRRWAGLGKGLYVTSRDNSFGAMCNSLTRVLVGSLVQPWRLAVSTQLLMGGICSPLLFIPLGVYLGVAQELTVGWLHAAVCTVQLMAMQQVTGRLFAITLEQPPSFWSFLRGAVVCMGIVFWALVVTCGLGHVRWGKTSYRVRGSRIVDVVPAAN
ncbi:MAG: hypothetical protein HBSAPP02_22270 [Phycisphaerae bacterium]|nr:MAG: glycosyltransferase [Planctomycetia bacterium]GJQ27195.1 MAG: hypothetical protein HBSAPP02_22270 [Phycisphaerae bacterium]